MQQWEQSHCRGQGFDSPRLHQPAPLCFSLARSPRTARLVKKRAAPFFTGKRHAAASFRTRASRFAGDVRLLRRGGEDRAIDETADNAAQNGCEPE